MTIKPLANHVLLEPLKAPCEAEGIILADNVHRRSDEAVVVAVGACKHEQPFSVGDVVVVPNEGGMEVAVEGKTYRLLAVTDVLGTKEGK